MFSFYKAFSTLFWTNSFHWSFQKVTISCYGVIFPHRCIVCKSQFRRTAAFQCIVELLSLHAANWYHFNHLLLAATIYLRDIVYLMNWVPMPQHTENCTTPLLDNLSVWRIWIPFRCTCSILQTTCPMLEKNRHLIREDSYFFSSKAPQEISSVYEGHLKFMESRPGK
jgi:hypothetical protein